MVRACMMNFLDKIPMAFWKNFNLKLFLSGMIGSKALAM